MEINPCPRCGKKAQLYYNQPYSWVGCPHCKLRGKMYADSYEKIDPISRELAVENWNSMKLVGAVNHDRTMLYVRLEDEYNRIQEEQEYLDCVPASLITDLYDYMRPQTPLTKSDMFFVLPANRQLLALLTFVLNAAKVSSGPQEDNMTDYNFMGNL